MATIEAFQEDLALFVEAGLVAIKHGDEESARKLFSGVGVLDPEHTSKDMGNGLIALHKMELQKAETLFRKVIKSDTTDYRAQSFLAFTLLLRALEEDEMKNEEKQNVLAEATRFAEEVIQKCDTPSTKDFAHSLIAMEKEMQEKGEAEKGPLG